MPPFCSLHAYLSVYAAGDSESYGTPNLPCVCLFPNARSSKTSWSSLSTNVDDLSFHYRLTLLDGICCLTWAFKDGRLECVQRLDFKDLKLSVFVGLQCCFEGGLKIENISFLHYSFKKQQKFQVYFELGQFVRTVRVRSALVTVETTMNSSCT